MKKIDEAKEILKELGLPKQQQNELAAFTLLALCGIKPRDKWNKTSRLSLKLSKGIIAFLKDVYAKTYAPNTRESIRKDVLHQFVQARIVDYNPDNPILPVNSPNTHYAITTEAHEAAGVFSKDKSRFYFTKFDPENKKECAIYLSKNINGKWLKPMKLDEHVNLEGYKSMQPTLSGEGNILYFSSDRPGGKGKMDIWYSYLNENGHPINLKNLSPKINSTEDDVDLFLILVLQLFFLVQMVILVLEAWIFLNLS